jgi:hypothetical protein
LGCQFPVRNTKWLKNGKLRRAILSAFYNISQRNFGIVLILWCSFKLWWNFCLDQNLVYNANGPLSHPEFCKGVLKDLQEMFEGTDFVFNILSQFHQTFLTNPLKLRIYPCKIPTVITETLIVYKWASRVIRSCHKYDSVLLSLFRYQDQQEWVWWRHRFCLPCFVM